MANRDNHPVEIRKDVRRQLQQRNRILVILRQFEANEVLCHLMAHRLANLGDSRDSHDRLLIGGSGRGGLIPRLVEVDV
jgi:hypothetical protein